MTPSGLASIVLVLTLWTALMTLVNVALLLACLKLYTEILKDARIEDRKHR